MDKSKRRKRVAYFTSSNPNKRRKSDSVLVAGMRGFICTCNGNEKGCIREALNILDDYNSRLNPSVEDSSANEESLVDDIEKQLKEEINDVKKPDRTFKVIDTGATNCLFISTKVKNVLELSEKIMKDAKDAPLAKSRFLIRLVPIEITCKAYNEDIKKAAESIFDAHFKCDPVSYCIYVNKRNNNNLLRMEVTDDLARLVRDRNVNHTVNLKNPLKTVIVEIIKNICCLSVVNNFFDFRKYNLIELGNTKNITESRNLTMNESSIESSNKDSIPETVLDDATKKKAEEIQKNIAVVDELSRNEKPSTKDNAQQSDAPENFKDVNAQED